MGSQVGVFGDKRAAEMALFMLHKMMNRAKKSSGIAVHNKGVHTKISGPDTPRKILSPHIDALEGNSAIATSLASIEHLKYAMHEDYSADNPPFSTNIGGWGFSISLDGEITNYKQLAKELDDKGAIMSQGFPRDQVFTHAMHQKHKGELEDKLFKALSSINGNYSVLGMIAYKGFAAITPQETFSLYALQSKDTTLVASEEAAFQIVSGYLQGKTTLQKLEGGKLYLFDHGEVTEKRFAKPRDLAHCLHENIRFANPVNEKMVTFKESLGAALTEYLLQTGIKLVTGVPNSSNHFLNGFFNEVIEKGHDFKQIITFMRNSYSGQKVLGEGRGENVGFHTKYTMAQINSPDKEIIIVKDTIRTGDSAREEVNQLRKLGFEKVVYATTMPPMMKNCEYRPDFIFAPSHVGIKFNHEQIAKNIGADGYIHLPMKTVLQNAQILGVKPNDFCIDCYID